MSKLNKSSHYWDKGRNINPKMSCPPGYEFNNAYNMDEEDTPNREKWRVPKSVDFCWHLDKVTEQITNLLKEKNEAYGNSALEPMNVFSKLDAVESLCCRLDDKIARVSNKGITDQTEDTVDDLIGYLLLLKMAMERKKQ